MAEKIKEPSSDLKKFDSLPVKKLEQKPKDIVSEFIDKANAEDAKIREEEKTKENPLVLAAHKEAAPVVEVESTEDNPLSAIYLKTHPNLLAEAGKTDWSTIATGGDY